MYWTMTFSLTAHWRRSPIDNIQALLILAMISFHVVYIISHLILI